MEGRKKPLVSLHTLLSAHYVLGIRKKFTLLNLNHKQIATRNVSHHCLSKNFKFLEQNIALLSVSNTSYLHVNFKGFKRSLCQLHVTNPHS